MYSQFSITVYIGNNADGDSPLVIRNVTVQYLIILTLYYTV